MATIYERVDALELAVTQAQSDIDALETALAQVAISDSEWLNLPLTDGVESYGSTQVPQYRKIGNIVFIRGAVKNVLATGTLGTLPIGYRPTTTVSFIQNTSLRTGNFPMFARYTINSSGEIRLEAISDGASFGESKWFPIMTTFTI